MGWDYMYTNGIKVNAKEMLDKAFSKSTRVLKSCMRGSVYYAAIELEENGEKQTTAYVVLTRQNKDGFGTKFMSETVGPVESNCPLSILNLLTPIDSKYANEWRKRCRENASKPKLGKLPIGTRIQMKDGTILICEAPSHQFKTKWWRKEGELKYIPKRYIGEFTLL